MFNRPNEEMTQEMVNEFYYKAKNEWEELLDEYGMTAVAFIYSKYQDIAIEYIVKYEEVKLVAENQGFTLPSLIEGTVIEFTDYLDEQDKELDIPKVLH